MALSLSSGRDVVLATISLHNMAGGLERNIVRIANYLAGRGHRVKIITFDLPDAVSFYPMDAQVEWVRAGRTPPHGKISFTDRVALIERIRFALPKHGAIIVFHHGLLARFMLASLGLKNRIFCSERNALALYDHIRASKWNLNFLLMGFVHKIIVQFDSYRGDYPFWYRNKIIAIPNVVEPQDRSANVDVPDNGRFRLLAVGRLCDQKNYGVLIEAFVSFAAKFPDWDLSIVGDGAFEETLKSQIERKGMAGRIILEGKSGAVAEWYARSHLFVMPSKWEGFPNALAEALSHGLPAVGFAQSAGVRDLIEDGQNGFLAEGMSDECSLSDKLSALMNDPAARARMGENAVMSMRKYSADMVYPQWEKLFENF